MSVHLIVLDTETGGLDPDEHCIIELAAQHVVIKPDCTVNVDGAKFHRYVKPDRPVNPEAAAINGYTEADWAGAQTMPFVAEAFLAWLAAIPHEDLIWAGSNVLGFDLPFLHSDFKRACAGYPGLDALPGKPKFARRTVNTESLCFPLFVRGEVESCGVAALRKWAGRDGDQHHRAAEDVSDAAHIIATYFDREVFKA